MSTETKRSTETKLIRFDWAMKTLLRDKANFDILEGFLSAVLRQDVTIIKILESESNVLDIDQKLNRVDILIQDQKQQYVIIEIQNCHVTAYLERILFGVSKVIVDNVKAGNDYRQISKVVSISILYFNLGLGEDYVFYGNTEFRGLHDNKPFVFRRQRADKKFDKLESQEIFPEYYLINVERFADEMETDLDEWIYLFKHAALPPKCHAKNLESVGEKLNVLKMTSEERHRYDLYLMAMVNEQDAVETALNKGLQKGIEQGLEQGLEQGREEGLEQGLQEGREEGEETKARKIAKRMLEAGIDIETIATMTDLNPSEI
jgi:predicted transposase/invertase (TIGR01784 family)